MDCFGWTISIILQLEVKGLHVQNICHVEKSLYNVAPLYTCSKIHVWVLKFQNLTKINVDGFVFLLLFRRLKQWGRGPCFSKTFADHWSLERKGVGDATDIVHPQHCNFGRPKMVQINHFKDFRIWLPITGYGYPVVIKEILTTDENIGRNRVKTSQIYVSI